MSPLFIRIMLHIHCSTEPYVHNNETGRQYPPAVSDCFREAYDFGLIEWLNTNVCPWYEGRFRLTPRGKAYVNRLITTPLPRKVETWVFDEQEAAE